MYSESDFNAELLLHGGYVWEEARATSVTLRLSAGDLASRRESRDGYDAEVEARRTELLGAKNWSAVMDFALAADELPPELLAWLRLALATPEQLAAAASVDDFASPMGGAHERLVVETLRVTTERQQVESGAGPL